MALLAAQTARRNDDYRAAMGYLRVCEQDPSLRNAVNLEHRLWRIQAGDLREVAALLASCTDSADGEAAGQILEVCIEAELKKSEERYDLALRATNEGVYDWNIADGTIFYSENVYRVLGAPAAMRTPQDWRRRIHPSAAWPGVVSKKAMRAGTSSGVMRWWFRMSSWASTSIAIDRSSVSA